ncbi:MAG TPA: hypothetical protein VIC31_09085 [Rudaea sp.]|jgi:hypothetical protein
MTQSPATSNKSTLPADWVAGRVLSQADVEQLRDLLAAGSGSACSPHAAAAGIASRMVAGLHPITTAIAKIASLLEPLVRIATSPTGFVVIALVLSLPLIWNPGYFSHDELQWLAFADKPSLADIPWRAWFDFGPFQYRPLTFNLWLLLSHYFGYQPISMHLLRALFGIAAAWLLRCVLLQFEVSARRATVVCWIWLLTPYTVYTHGWIGTYADSLCLIFMLMALRLILMQPAGTWRQSVSSALPVAALTVLALMSKESAVVFPAVILIAAIRRRDRILAAAFAASSAVLLAYLALRLQTILFPHEVSGAYRWGLDNIPARLAEYTVFPFMAGHFEVIAGRSYLTVASLLCLAIFAAALASTGWRRFVVFWLGWIVMLGPVLILALSANHYAYLAGAFACACVGCVWNRAKLLAKLAFAIIAVVIAVHGIQGTRQIRHIGRVQHHLYADLMPLLAHGTTSIRIQAQRNKDDFILRRLLNDIPSYRRQAIGDHVSVIDFSDKVDHPDYVMSGDGHLIPAR